ncbi:serine hydrolase domain-containing protein [Melittangium boletus]|uniref:Beta-lactamase-related domain-containing protein n=1 Tax=Melittangium boletus DSM 14713 TaxID=1294270 RepID=A0A250IJA4_9BACT|nr:serine hydrolase domain-containing protein [Melittangium boletus]ATB31242.1 hypothetical protein MEBOL_004704 [Melittangium boletus DSM 14713]
MGLTVLVLVLLGAATPVRAQTLPGDSAEPLDAFVRRVVTRQLADHRIPGATVLVVRDGRVVLTQGHGEADTGRGLPVDAERTLFRVASVGKLFVWTAVMRLVERGQLELDTDVNTWLEEGLQLPRTFPEPVTLRHLMAHTGGFAVPERLWPAGPTPDALVDYLQERRPPRVRPPGELSAYSDYGAALAEHIVERVTGQPFEDHLREEIWEPLGMRRTLFRRSVPPEFVADTALGHPLEQGRPRAQPLERVVVASSGSMLTTAPDLARFMLAHLHGGAVDGHRILGEETVRRMHQQHFTHDARLSGWAHGFMEFHLNGRRLLGHTGDAYQFTSLLVLMPEHGWGLFVSYNGLGERNAAQRARMELLRALLDRDFPAPPPRAPTKRLVTRPERFTGTYQTTWRSSGTAEASLAWRQEIRVREEEGTLRVHQPGMTARRWVEKEPLLFQPAETPDAPDRVAFREDAQGHITHLFLENRPLEAYERAPWYDTAPVALGLFAGCGALFALAVGMGLLLRTGAVAPLAALSLWNLLVLTGVVLLVRPLVPFDGDDTPWLLGATRTSALLGVGLTPGALFWSARTGRRGGGSWTWRLLFSGVALASALLTLWLHHWHLLGGG